MLTNEEIRTLLLEKHDRIIRGQNMLQLISLLISIGCLTYLVLTAALRLSDSMFVVLNAIIILILILITYLYSKIIQQLYSNNKENGNIKKLLEARIKLFERLSLYSKWDSGFLVIFTVLFSISINAFFSHTNISTVFTDEESCWGLLFGNIVAIITGLIMNKAITKRFKKNLSALSFILKKI